MTPDERYAQQCNALKRANEVRLYRVKVKAAITATKRDADEVLTCGDPLLQQMSIEDLVRAVPGIGKTAARQLLARGAVGPSTTLEQLTERQRGYLLVTLRRHRAENRWYARAKAAA
jgi:hypothetical protein